MKRSRSRGKNRERYKSRAVEREIEIERPHLMGLDGRETTQRETTEQGDHRAGRPHGRETTEPGDHTHRETTHIGRPRCGDHGRETTAGRPHGHHGQRAKILSHPLID